MPSGCGLLCLWSRVRALGLARCSRRSPAPRARSATPAPRAGPTRRKAPQPPTLTLHLRHRARCGVCAVRSTSWSTRSSFAPESASSSRTVLSGRGKRVACRYRGRLRRGPNNSNHHAHFIYLISFRPYRGPICGDVPRNHITCRRVAARHSPCAAHRRADRACRALGAISPRARAPL